MFHKQTYLEKSTIHGIGLFAGEDIEQDDLLYTINSSLDLIISQEAFSQLNLDEQKTIMYYGYKNENTYHLSFDNIRFCNHSLNGNISLRGNEIYALKQINKGEELTQNYSEFEQLRDELQ